MKWIAFFLLLNFGKQVNAQKIAIDKTDPFTNNRTITTSPLNLKKVAMTNILIATVSCEKAKDSIIKTTISFIIPDMGIEINNADTIKPYCLIKCSNDSLVNGIYQSDAKVDLMGKKSHIFNFMIDTKDIGQLKNYQVTAVKFFNSKNEGGMFEVDKNAQDKISKAIELLSQTN